MVSNLLLAAATFGAFAKGKGRISDHVSFEVNWVFTLLSQNSCHIVIHCNLTCRQVSVVPMLVAYILKATNLFCTTCASCCDV